MAADHYHLIPPIRHISSEVYNFAVPTLQRSFDTNPIGAMPSLHTAFPCLCTFIAFHHFGRRAIPLALYTLSVLFVIAYLGEHYLVDILAGVLLAGVIYVLCYRVSSLSRRMKPATKTRRSRLETQVGIAVLLFLASEGIGRGGQAMRRSHGRLIQRPFIEDNLIGRSDRAHSLLASIALDEGDSRTAVRELELSVQELKDAQERIHAQAILQSIRAMNEPSATPPESPAPSPKP
jgi:hypothetical protein